MTKGEEYSKIFDQGYEQCKEDIRKIYNEWQREIQGFYGADDETIEFINKLTEFLTRKSDHNVQ